MQLKLTSQRRDTPLKLSRSGDTLTINGEAFDFSELPDGATLPPEAIDSEFFNGPVERTGGVLHISLILPRGRNAPEENRYPAPITLKKDGPVDLPAYEIEETFDEQD